MKLVKQKTVASEMSLAGTLAVAVDNLHTLRTERLAAQKAVDRMEEQEKELRAQVEASMRALNLDNVHGERAQVYYTRIQVPQLIDDEEFLNWAKRKANIDCLKIGVNHEAWRLRFADGELAPGTEAFLKETLQVKGLK